MLWLAGLRADLYVRPASGTGQNERGTYVVPDGHDQDHGHLQGLVELREAADLAEAVTITECLKLVRAELRSDGAAL